MHTSCGTMCIRSRLCSRNLSIIITNFSRNSKMRLKLSLKWKMNKLVAFVN